MTIAEAVQKFITGYFGASVRSVKTLRAYTRDLEQLRDFMGIEHPLTGVEPESLEAWAKHMKSRPYATASIRRKFAAAKVFFNYWVRRGVIANSPLWRMRLSLGKEQVLPRSLAPGDARRLLEAVWQGVSPSTPAETSIAPSRFLKLRDIAIIETLFATGIRVGELVSLRIADWRVEDSCFLVRGKGSRERLAFFPDQRSLGAINVYITHRLKLPLVSEALFLNAAGTPLSEQGVACILSRLAQGAQIDRRITPHMIRHTVATLLLRYGADLRIVQEVLGHTSITTTQRYVHVAKDHLMRTLQTCHPNHHLGVRLPGRQSIANLA